MNRTLCLLGFLLTGPAVTPCSHAGRLDIPAPPGAPQFGTEVKMLPNGNFVVVDEGYTPPESSVATGGVFLYKRDGTLISVLTGGKDGDRAGSGGITVLASGNFVVNSPQWDNGGIVDAGAVTWVSMSDGLNGVISPTNSLVGSRPRDKVGGTDSYVTSGAGGVVALGNGHYVVCSPAWDNGASLTDAGAVTWGNGATGISGPVSSSNSLVGSVRNSLVGRIENGLGVTQVGSHHYVVYSSQGVTWCDGTTGRTGTVTEANSLVGTGTQARIVVLGTGDYVVANPAWKRGAVSSAGAVTWCSGNSGRSGQVTEQNSLVGTSENDRISIFTTPAATNNLLSPVEGVVPLKNGNYVVVSSYWSKEALPRAGAVTLCSKDGTTTGPVTSANSVTGGTAGDMLTRILPLASGDYVIAADQWDNGTVINAGAVRLMSGVTASTGELTADNSLVGTNRDDRVSSGPLTALTNGNFVISSPLWRKSDELTKTGAVTWISAATGLAGPVTAANSFTGRTSNQSVGGSATNALSGGWVTALTNGNYVISSPAAGMVTWADGTKGIVGEPDAGNSIIRVSFNAAVRGSVTALPNGNFVISNPNWAGNYASLSSGAVTWWPGNVPTTGYITESNSLYSLKASQRLGQIPPIIQSDGNYIQLSTATPGYVTALSGTRATSLDVGSGVSIAGGAISFTTLTSKNVSTDPTGKFLLVGNGSTLVTLYYNLLPDAAKLRVDKPDGNPLQSDKPLDLGHVSQGSVLTFQLTLRNPSAFPLTLKLGAPSDSSFTVSLPVEQEISLAAGASLRMPITFNPAGTGVKTASIPVTSNDPDGPFTIVLSGEVPVSSPSRFTDILPPPGSGEFGTQVTWLPNGNLVVTDPKYDPSSSVQDAGAVYLYSASGALLSTTTGGEAGAGVGTGGVTVLKNGNFLIRSKISIEGKTRPVLTWVNGTTGLNAVISPANSLVGPESTPDLYVTELGNGHYVVFGYLTSYGGAVRWADGTQPLTGTMDSSNSLIVTEGFFRGITVLANGNYVVQSFGSVTLAPGTAPMAGVVSELNSLLFPPSSSTWANVVTALTDGNFVVALQELKIEGAREPGCVLWCDGVVGRKGSIPPQEALVSTGLNTATGQGGIAVTALPGGKYAVHSTNRGMLTWCQAGGLTRGEITEENSLLGDIRRLTVLPGGGVVVTTAPANFQSGAVALIDPQAPLTGPLSAENALVGNPGSAVGSGGITVLDDGNYVVNSPLWSKDGYASREGAVTWCDGRKGRPGLISPENSLTGWSLRDQAGLQGVSALRNGHFLIGTPRWQTSPVLTWMPGATDGAGVPDSGNSITGLRYTPDDSTPYFTDLKVSNMVLLAGGNYTISTISPGGKNLLTWVDGSRTAAFEASEENSIVGLGIYPNPKVTALANGNGVILSNAMDGDYEMGSATWLDGRRGLTGKISTENSLVCKTYAFDAKPWKITAWPDGAYAVHCVGVSNGSAYDAGAFVFGDGSADTAPRGSLTYLNSVRGERSSGGPSLNTSYDVDRKRWAVGRPKDNKVTHFSFRPSEAGRLSLEEPEGIALADGGVIDFGLTDPGQTVERPVFLANSGGSPLDLGAITLTDPQFQVASPPQRNVLPPGGRTVIRLRFAPVSPGLKTGSFQVSSSDPQQPAITVALLGTARPLPEKPFGDENAPAEITAVPGGKLRVRFKAMPRIAYNLQRSSDLQSWNFTCMVTADDAGLVTFVDDAAGSRARFYRLKSR